MYLSEKSMKFHVLNQSGKLEAYAARLVTIGESAILKIQEQLPITNVDIVLYYNPSFTIPEIGMCGNAPTPDTVWIALDPDNVHFAQNLQEEFVATLAHELYHCMRHRGPGCGYGTNLADALINEGLALAFEFEFRTSIPARPFYEPLSDEEYRALYALAEREFRNASYHHGEWFFAGSSSKRIPPYAGYRLGHGIVRRFMASTGKQPRELWGEVATSFLVV